MSSNKKSPDIILFILTLAILVIGLFMVYNSSYARAGQEKYSGYDSLYYLKHQAVFAVFGLVLMFATIKFPYWKLRGLGIWLFGLSILLLVLVLVPGIGKLVDGARRWMSVGGFTVQPSEFAKYGLIIYMAGLLTSIKGNIRDVKQGLFWALLPLAPIGVLIMAEPDMGTLIVFTIFTLSMIYMAGAKKRHMALILAGGFLLGTILVCSADYRMDRVRAYVDPFKYQSDEGYQVCQSLIALGSGGPLGTGICDGRAKLFYLPAEHTDFIFAVWGEETGIIGTLGILALFLGIGIRGFIISQNTKDPFGRFLAGGVSAMICGQAFLNMSVVTSLLPNTGVPLPFISYGGSSLVSNLLCIGILLGISQYPGTVESYDHENSPNRRRDGGTRVSGNRNRRSPSRRPKTSVLR